MSLGIEPAPRDRSRFFLSLPPGSVRAILSLLIVFQFWLILMLPPEEADQARPIGLHLYLLLGLVLLFFVSHGRTIAGATEPEPSPLWLPGGVLRILMLGGTVGLLAYLHFSRGEDLSARLTPDPDEFKRMWFPLFSAVIIGFSIGYILRSIPGQRSIAFKALQAWISVVAMLLMVVSLILDVTILPSLEEKINLDVWYTILTGVVSFYFGLRS